MAFGAMGGLLREPMRQHFWSQRAMSDNPDLSFEQLMLAHAYRELVAVEVAGASTVGEGSGLRPVSGCVLGGTIRRTHMDTLLGLRLAGSGGANGGGWFPRKFVAGKIFPFPIPAEERIKAYQPDSYEVAV